MLRGASAMIVRPGDYGRYRDRLEALKVKELARVGDLLVLTQTTTGRRLLLGRVKCPYCGRELELSITIQQTPGGPSVEQFISDFINHMDNEHPEFFKEWVARSDQPYQQGSWHTCRFYVCRKCGYKSRRLTDALAHAILKHKLRVG